MNFFLGLVGVIAWIFGLMTVLAAKSAIHEILGSLGLGFGTLTLCLVVLVAHVKTTNDLLGSVLTALKERSGS